MWGNPQKGILGMTAPFLEAIHGVVYSSSQPCSHLIVTR